MKSPVTHFVISLDRKDARYSEGEEVKGQVVFDLSDYDYITEVSIDFSGTAIVTDLRPKRGRRQAPPAKITEKHLNQKLTLYSTVSDDDANNLMTLVPGRHLYRFQIQLPFNLPSTIRGKHGFIRYFARAAITGPWHAAIITRKEFIIRSILDLNYIPGVDLPLECHKTFQARPLKLCFPLIDRDHEYVVTWHLDRTGYIPGESITIRGEIQNTSKVAIKETKALLMQHIQYFDTCQYSVVERKQVAGTTKPAIESGATHAWHDHMVVPVLPPSGLKSCGIMNVWYTLEFQIYPSGSPKPLETSIEITIGTVAIATGTLDINTVSLEHTEDYSYFI